MTQALDFDGKTYYLRAILVHKSKATLLAKINRAEGFSVRITEQENPSKRYWVWARQKKPGYAIEWLTLRNLGNISIPRKNFGTVVYKGEVEMD